MTEIATSAGWLSRISQRVREREMRRQTLYNQIPEFLKMLMGSLLGLWMIDKALSYIFHANSLYTLPVFGLLFSVQATYYKFKFSTDPGYRIPKCRCAGRKDDQTNLVFQSRESAILGIPNSLLGFTLYMALLVLVFTKHNQAALWLSATAVAASAMLSYVMIVRIRGLCANCINVAALNMLLLWRFILANA